MVQISVSCVGRKMEAIKDQLRIPARGGMHEKEELGSQSRQLKGGSCKESEVDASRKFNNNNSKAG